MKTQKMNKPVKKIILALFVVLMIIPFTSCNKKISFLNSTVVPGADGFVKVKKDKNKNYIVQVEVTDLADVARVQASKTTYVVWMETDEGNAQNLGQLISSTSMFSKRHKASMETASSYKPVRIFITTEEGINTQYPGRQVVLTTEEFEIK